MCWINNVRIQTLLYSVKNLRLAVPSGILGIQILNVEGCRGIRQLMNGGLQILEYESLAIKRGFFFFFLTRLFITFWAVFSLDVTNLGNVRKGVFSERLGNYLSLGSRVLKFKFNSC